MDINQFTNDFVEEWNGKNLNINGAPINFDGRFGTQCMDLWNYFWTELGIKGIQPHPDAASVWEDTSGSHYQYFDGILPDSPAKRGDVFIYNRKAWGTGYGHIGIVLSDNGQSITVLETNGLGDGYEDKYMNQFGSPPRIHVWPKTNLYGYLRYINEEDDMALSKEDKDFLISERKMVVNEVRANANAVVGALAKTMNIDEGELAKAFIEQLNKK